jgi:hypothetical protein
MKKIKDLDAYRQGYEDCLKESSYTLVDNSFSEEKKDLYAKQRAERGFDDTELWNLNTTIAQFILPRLKRFREINKSYPKTLSEEEWNEILDKMIKFFEEYLDENNYLEDNLEKEGIELFAKYFLDLWW